MKRMLCTNSTYNWTVLIPDLAVGAPYEGAGAVYIYSGSRDGLPSVHTQRIYARDLSSNTAFSAFGSSVAGGADLDDNGYPDLVVGAYQSDAIAVLLSRPVVNIDASISATPKYIDTSEQTCSMDHSANVCFQVKVSFKFTAEPRSKWDFTFSAQCCSKLRVVIWARVYFFEMGEARYFIFHTQHDCLSKIYCCVTCQNFVAHAPTVLEWMTLCPMLYILYVNLLCSVYLLFIYSIYDCGSKIPTLSHCAAKVISSSEDFAWTAKVHFMGALPRLVL